MVKLPINPGFQKNFSKKNYFQKFLFQFGIHNLGPGSGPVPILNQIPIPVPKEDSSSNWVFTK
jgi:hypothetical protein